MLDPKRLEEQQNFVNLWKLNNFKGSAEWATGTGKTQVGIMCVEQTNPTSTIVIVPTLYLKEQWEKRVSHLSNITILVVNTAIKNTYIVDLLILDEIHRMAADTFSRIFECVTYNKILGLTATLERSDKKHYLLEKECPVLHKITVKEALQKEYISDFVMYNYGVLLPTQERETYDFMDRNFQKTFGFFGHDFTLAMDCLTKEPIRRIYSQQTGYTTKEIQIRAINFNRAMNKRKNFIYYNDSKLRATIELIKKFNDKKVIVFSERLEIAQRLHEYFPNSGVYQPKQSKRTKEELMNKYSSGEINLLFAARALDEGMDIPDIDVGIVHSSTSSKRQTTQRNGRVLRKMPDKVALIINVYLEDTQDKKWLIERIKSIPNSYWVNNIEDINYEPGEGLLKEENRISDFTRRIRI